MKKPIIALIALIIAAGGSLGAFFAVKGAKNKEERQAQEELADNALFSFDSESVTRITFEGEQGEYTAERSEDGVWKLSSEEFTLDQTYLQLICTYTSTLVAEQNFGALTDEKKSMYGLDTPDRLEITEPGGTHTIYIGDMSPTGEFFYVTVDGKSKVYAISSDRGSVLRTERMLLKNKELLPYTLYDLSEVVTYKDGKVLCDLTFDPDSQLWSLPKAYADLELDQTAVTAVLNNIVRIEAEEMLDESLGDLSKYGLDKPYGEAVVKGIDGTERHLLASLNEDNPVFSFVLVDGEQVEVYYTADMDFMKALPHEYLVENIVSASIYNIDGFTFSYQGSEDECTVSFADKECTYNGKSIDLNNNETYVSFLNFYDAFSILKTTGTDIDAKPALEDPVMTAEFSLKDGKDVKIDITGGDDGKYYIFRNGKYIGAYVEDTMFTGRSSLSEFYVKFKKIAGIE